MPVMIQVRNVPDSLHRKLKSRATLEGKTLSDYLLGELARSAERPTIAALRERLNARESVLLTQAPHDAVREERDSR